MTIKTLTTAVVTTFLFNLMIHFSAFAKPLSIDSIKNDMSFLSSDELKGRRVFTPQLDIAANYIAERFKRSGLQKFKGSYKQTFPIFYITPNSIKVSINGIDIPQEKTALATTVKSLYWGKESEINQVVIGKDDNLTQTLNKLNLAGGNHLVVVHHKHEELFSRYQNYFRKGLTKLDDSNTGSILLVLNNSSTINDFEANASASFSTKQLTNVVGVLPGKELAHEVVLYSAHYDHLGEKTGSPSLTSSHQDLIYNGADDNASGVTGVLNLAQFFAQKRRNSRTLIFVAFTAEEVGGYGSKYFSQHIPADNISAMINLEMIGKPSKFGAGKLWMTGSERSDLVKMLNNTLRSSKTQIYPDPYPEEKLFYRSDNATLARLGVPAHSFSTVQLKNDEHYHAPSDEFKTVNIQSLTKAIETLARSTSPLITGKSTPSRVDVSKVTPDGKIY